MVLLTGACATTPAGDRDAAIGAWARARYGDTLRGEPQIFYGDFTGDGAPDALAWMTYNDGGLHNFGEGVLFRARGGRMVFWRVDETALGEAPRDVTFAPGRITLTTTVLQDGDARCCPTGEQDWTIETR
jgi:hypothetical protein